MPQNDSTFTELLDEIASKTPAPGGGYVAAAVGALGAALAGMVLAYSIDKKSLAQHAATNTDALEQLTRAREVLLQLAREDALAYEELNALQKNADGSRDEKALLEAARLATMAPMSSACACADILRVLESLTHTTNRWLASDLAIAAILADAGARACVWNVRINLPTLAELGESAQQIETIRTQAEELLAGAHERAEKIEQACQQKD